MLFHITHIHSPESCPYHNPEKARDTFGKVLASGKEPGVNLIGAWVDAPAHTAYFVVETDSAEKIEELLASGSAKAPKCPKCKSLLVFAGKGKARCSNKECKFEKNTD